MGGSRAAERPSNGLMLCWWLNDALERDADVKAAGLAYGWAVSAYTDPATVPFFDVTTGSWWRLDDEWNRWPAEAPEVA